MQLCKTPTLPAQRVRLPTQSSRSVLVRATSVEQETRKEASSPSSSGAKEIYIGFPKNDYAPRAGRKGRVIVDDPSKYPAKDNLGPLLGATGGWAGGEAALNKLKESIKAEMTQTTSAPVKPQAADPTVIAPSGQPIYVGFGKDELELKKTGVTGRVIIDEPSKYPNKEDIGPLSGATGGFAGGERGLRAFVETGEVNIRKPGEPGGQPMSPLSIAFLMLLAGAGGAALLTQFSAGEGGLTPDMLQSLTSSNAFTVNLLTGALTFGVLAGGIYAVQSVKTQIEDTTKEVVVTGTKLAVYAIFFASVFLAARAVLDV